jgi:two-component system NarL family response regulator
MIRVMVVDDHDLFRVGLASELKTHPELEIVAQASGGKAAIRLAGELRPDVILMDLSMPDVTGPEATREILKRDPSIRVVALTIRAEEADIQAALSAGASGYVLKDASSDDVVAAMRAAIQGAAWLSPKAAAAVAETIRKAAEEGLAAALEPAPSLSRREIEVLRLIATGLDNNEIAAELGISLSTVKNHVSRILWKLGVGNRLEAAVYAVRQGIA